MYGACGSKERSVFTIEPSGVQEKDEEKTPFLLRSSFLPSAMSTVSMTMRKVKIIIDTLIASSIRT